MNIMKLEKITKFFLNQIIQINKGGFSFLFRKLWLIQLYFLALIIVFLVRILRPFVHIRFGSLYSDRIGHFALTTELYLCCKDANEFYLKFHQ